MKVAVTGATGFIASHVLTESHPSPVDEFRHGGYRK
jgi:UDP-glucose 4-epimerase